jgi:hypothetical protein
VRESPRLHLIEDEETDMFPQARKIFDRTELAELGKRMAARKVTAKAAANQIAARRER